MITFKFISKQKKEKTSGLQFCLISLYDLFRIFKKGGANMATFMLKDQSG